MCTANQSCFFFFFFKSILKLWGEDGLAPEQTFSLIVFEHRMAVQLVARL